MTIILSYRCFISRFLTLRLLKFCFILKTALLLEHVWVLFWELFDPYSGENGTKTLRQLHAEEEDEERFQADLKKAVRQSLGKMFAITSFSIYIWHCSCVSLDFDACFMLLHHSYSGFVIWLSFRLAEVYQPIKYLIINSLHSINLLKSSSLFERNVGAI